jgi:hypothetical protein
MKRTFDQMDRVTLDSLSTEILLHLIVVGRLANTDISALASLNWSYRNTLVSNKDYLRKRGLWTVNLIDGSCRTHPKVRLLHLPLARLDPRQRAVVYKDENNEDLMLISYYMWDPTKSAGDRGSYVVLLAAYADTMYVKWAHRYPTSNTPSTDLSETTFLWYVLSPIGIIAILHGTNRIVVLDSATGHLIDRYKHCTLPFTYGEGHELFEWKGLLCVIVKDLTEYWALSLNDTDEIQCTRMHLASPGLVRASCKTDYIALEQPMPGSLKKIVVTKKPHQRDSVWRPVAVEPTIYDVTIHGDELISSDGTDIHIVDLRTLSLGKLERSTFKQTFGDLWKITSDGNILITKLRKSYDVTAVSWFNRRERKCTRTDATDAPSGVITSTYMEEQTGCIWLYYASNSSIHRTDPDDADFENLGIVMVGKEPGWLLSYKGIIHVVASF